MSQKPTYLQLAAGEDIPSIRDRLSFIRGQRVILIWPEEGTALKRKLDLVLVQREAKRRVIQLALVTHDPEVIIHADELGISTFETIKDAETNRWKRGRTRVFVQRHHKPEESPDPEDLMPVASRVRKPRKPVSVVVMFLLRFTVLTIVLGTILGTIYLVLPSAQVELVMDTQVLTVSSVIIADPDASDIDVDNGIIPATRYSVDVETTQRIETTGSEAGTNARAIGTVAFNNAASRSISIPSGTRLTTSTGRPVIFETTSDVTIPANGSVDRIPIIAAEEFAGEIGNVDASTINRFENDAYSEITVRNILPTFGGDNQSNQVVTPEDMDYLMSITRQALQAQAYADIEANLSDTQTIIIETLHISEDELRNDWINFSHGIGDTSDNLILSMRAIVEALIIDDRLSQQVVFAQISRQRPANMILNPESFLYLRGSVIQTDLNGRTSFNASGEGIATAQLDSLRLQNDLAGRSLEEAQRLIAATVEIESGSQAQITISPDWFNQMPYLPVRISISTRDNR